MSNPPISPLNEAHSLPIDPRRFHHEYPDHEYWRYLNTGEPLRMFCGRHLTPNQFRAVTVCEAELPPCPECVAAKTRREAKVA